MVLGLKTRKKKTHTHTQANIARKGSVFSPLVFFLLSDSPTTEFYVPTFRNTLWRRSLFLSTLPVKMEQSVPKRRHINFRRREITQNKE